MKRSKIKKDFTEEEIQSAVDKIIHYVEVEGYSVSAARAMVLEDTSHSKLIVKAMRTQDYVDCLNRYMNKIGRTTRYKLYNKSIISITKKDREL